MNTTIVTLLIAALITACISGIFGMAGGLVFMFVLAVLYDVNEAMVIHGAVQGVSNSYRSYLVRKDIRWDIIRRMLIGALPVALPILIAQVVVQGLALPKGPFLILLGLLPFLLWLPKDKLAMDASRPRDAYLSGVLVSALNLLVGVAGPALDFFYVKTKLTRHEIVATKAVTMFISHLMKIVVFGLPMLLTAQAVNLPPWWFFIAVVPFVMAGTFTGTRILHMMSDVGFRQYTKYLVTAIGVVYLWRGLTEMGWIG